MSLPLALAAIACVITPPSAVSSMSAEEASAMARGVAPEVERLRGREFKRPVPVRIEEASVARGHLLARFRRFEPEERLRLEEKAREQLGLLPAGFDLVGTLFSLLEEQVGGYYDPDSGAFVVVGGMPRSIAPMIMAHELTHALDDQRYSLDGLAEKVMLDDDRQEALTAVIEGSGTLVMTAYMLKETKEGRFTAESLEEMRQVEEDRSAGLLSAPPYLARELVAPYILGQSFLLRGDPARITSAIRAEDIDRAFHELPASTEQILHPEKYWDAARRDPPRVIVLANLAAKLGPDWSLAASGTLGELTLAALTGATAPDLESADAAKPESWTNAAAAGWGGDRWQLYENAAAGRAVTLLETVWDTPQDATEFMAALKLPAGCRVASGPGVVAIACGDGEEAALPEAALASPAPSH